MPVSFRVPEVLNLDKYGVFTMQRVPGQSISSDYARSISTSDIYDKDGNPRPFTKYAPYAMHTVNVKKGWGMVIERFNWGDTSRPDKVYYEVWNYGALLTPQAQEGYHCGAFIGESNMDNRSTHPAAANKIELRVWNATGSSPENVFYEFSLWYYLFDMRFYDKIMSLSYESQINELKRIAGLLEELNKNLREIRAPEVVRGLPLEVR